MTSPFARPRDSFTRERRALLGDLIELGEALRGPEFDPRELSFHPDANDDYTHALECYEEAGTALDAASHARSLRQVATVLTDGRFLVASARARLEGKDPAALGLVPPQRFAGNRLEKRLGRVATIGAAVVLAGMVAVAGVGVGRWAIDLFSKSGILPASARQVSTDWSLNPVSTDPICSETEDAVHVRVLGIPEPVRLSDQILDESPIPRFDYGGAGGPSGPPWTNTRPWLYDALVKNRATEGYIGGFSAVDKPGGFGIAVYEFPSSRLAVRAARESYFGSVCKYGADPYRIPERPEILFAVLQSDSTLVSWVHGRRLVTINYAMYGDPTEDRRDALLVAQETWELNQP